MPDWELTEQRIYQLLKHPYQIDKSVVENMTSAYLEFVEELFAYIANTKVWGIERSGFFNGREKWAKGFENQRV